MTPFTRPRAIRRTVGVALATALALAGCSAQTDNATQPPAAAELPPCPVGALAGAPGPVEVVLWYQLNGKPQDVIKSQIDKYNASQNKVKVRAESQGSDYDELFDQYKRGIPAKQLPDILVADETATRFLVDSKTVLAAQKCFEADHLSTDGFNQAAVNYYRVGGVYYPASVSLSDLVVYYNKTQFKKAGLDPDKPPATLEDVRAYAQKIRAAGIVDKPLIMKLASWFLETQATGAHQAMVDNDNGHGPGQTTKATFETDTVRQIYTWIETMVRDGLLNPKPDSPGQFDHLLATAQQSASMTVETSTAITTVDAVVGGGDRSVAANNGVNAVTTLTPADVGVAPLFGVTGAGKVQVGGNAMYITNQAGDAKQAAAWDFMKWWNGYDQQKVWHVQGSYLPFLTALNQDPEIQAFWKNTFAGQMLKVASDELAGIDPNFGGPAIGPYRETRAAIRASLDKVGLAGGDPNAALSQAVTDVDAALKAYNEGL